MTKEYDPNDWYWVIAGDESQVYASARAIAVSVDDEAYQSWLKDENVPTHIKSQEDLVQVLNAANVAPYHMVSTYKIVRRLEEAGLADAAQAALDSNKLLWRRFYTVGKVYAQDPLARQFLEAIGANVDEILAEE